MISKVVHADHAACLEAVFAGGELVAAADVADDPGSERLVGFFFQAEDGIRVALVTGVQTCALPISRVGWRPERLASAHEALPSPAPVDPPEGSEERRVGKECRSRCTPYH